jgi:hypothetical protein
MHLPDLWADVLLSAEAVQNRLPVDVLLSAEAAQNRLPVDVPLSAEAAQNRLPVDVPLSAEAVQNRLSDYRLHRVIENIDLDGVVVPGLRGSFFRRPYGTRTQTVGLYEYDGSALFMAWGYVGEEHCRFTALRRDDGSWQAPRPGCPDVSPHHSDGRVTALTVGGHVLPTQRERGDQPVDGSGSLVGATRAEPEPSWSRQRGSGTCSAAGEVASLRT